MDYSESKIKDIIREACVQAIEANAAFSAGVLKSRNPYYSVESITAFEQELNNISSNAYEDIKRKL